MPTPAVLRVGGALGAAGGLEQVAAGAHGSYNEADRGEAAAEAQHVDVERVASCGAFGSAGAGERFATDHGAEALDHGAREARFNRRQRHPR